MQKDPFSSFLILLNKYPSIHYKRGETILRAGDLPSGVFILQKGYIKLCALSKEGEELILIIYKPHDFFPMLWSFKDTPNKYYFEAMTAVEVKRVPRQVFLEFVKENPQALIELTARILVRLGGLLERMEYLVFGNAYTKVASIVSICAERFGTKEGNSTIIQVPLTHRDIGLLIGLTRETTSVEMKKLERKGIIAYRGRLIIVKDIKGLHQESLFT